MADSKRRKPRKSKDPAAPAQPFGLTEEQQGEHAREMAAKSTVSDRAQTSQLQELRLNMMRSLVTEPLLSKVQRDLAERPAGSDARFEVIISLNELFEGGMPAALKFVQQRASEWKVRWANVSNYVFACLSAKQILDLAEEARQLARAGPKASVVYRIWEDNDVSVTLTRSLTTVKADAAQRAFQATGEGIVWAVLDSGIDGTHPHFAQCLDLPLPLAHVDFTPAASATQQQDGQTAAPAVDASALVDRFGHGSHVAGIIGGHWESKVDGGENVVGTETRDEQSNDPIPKRDLLRSISGVAPKCKLVSLKVIADTTIEGDIKQTTGQGKVSWVIMAIDQIQKWNQNGKRILIHGANLSLGYNFDPRWFACGQSPICVEVNRLVKSGVSVVVAAGNGGYSSFIAASGEAESRYSDLSITDPGNAELAITVGSTHREMPHTYGVSYFSSRGPTGDGRMKPDLLAPGERIISCAAGLEVSKYGVKDENGNDIQPVLYCEQTGTSMAAPHLSGAIAAFLSVRTEFVGSPERVKEIFMANTIDLRRERCFQGAGLLDLMKVLQAV